MLVGKERGHDRDAGPRGPRQGKASGEPGEKSHYTKVHDARDPQRVGNAKALGNGKEAGAAIVLDILAGVEDVEAADP